MKELKAYTIPFVGLKLGAHEFSFKVEQPFFEHFEYDDFNNARINLDVVLEKKTTLLEFDFDFSGTVNVLCDLTNEPFDLPLDGKFHLVVKFGHEFNDQEEDLLIIPHGSHEVSIQQYVYESIVLALPARRIHPGVADGSLQSEVLEKLEELKPTVDGKSDSNSTDPRWDDLKKLLTDK